MSAGAARKFRLLEAGRRPLGLVCGRFYPF